MVTIIACIVLAMAVIAGWFKINFGQLDLNIKRLAMKDEEYRKELKTMNRKRENEKNREV